jgi:hypothetical protein
MSLRIIKSLVVIVMVVMCSAFAKAQSIQQIDSVALMMCDHLKDLKVDNDTARLEYLYKSQLYPYLETIKASKKQEIGNRVYYRLQRNCTTFSELLDRLEPPKEASERVTVKPIPVATTQEIKEFKVREEFYYFEINGDTTRVQMKNGLWKDHFTDNSYSNLKYKWLNEHEFELTFLESDNEGRSLFSAPGDTYIYQLVSKMADYYQMSVHIPGQKVYAKFKLYFKD